MATLESRTCLTTEDKKKKEVLPQLTSDVAKLGL